MGLADRGYLKDGSGGGILGRGAAGAGMTFTTMLIIANIAVFFLGAMLPHPTAGSVFHKYGHFSTYELVRHLEFWRVLTFQFLHANLIHLMLNMLGLWVFGKIVEEYLGFKRYAAFYLVCGVFGAVMYLLLNLLGAIAASAGQSGLPLLIYNSAGTPLVGASAGVFGVIMASAYIAPKAQMQLIFPPVALPLKVLAYTYVGIALFNLVIGGSNAGGDAAHIGGAIAGFFFVRNSHLLRDFFDIFGDSRKSGAGRSRGTERQAAEVDRILAKVSARGVQSLTAREKRTLQRATDRRPRAGTS